MSKSPKFKCPQCLADVIVSADAAGTQVQCPVCNASLTAPLSIGHDALFDDLFDDPGEDSSDQESGTFTHHIGDEDKLDLSDDPTVEESRSETKHPIPIEIPANATTEVESVIPISDVITISDEIDVVDEIQVIAGEQEQPSSSNPFDYDENKNIHIEGVTDGLLAPGSFFFKCPICDSHIKANEDQLGDKVKCSDCYSEIIVAKPDKPKEIEPWRRPATLKSSDDDDDEFKLADPVDRPPVDYSISPEYGLDEVQGDLLTPLDEPELVSEPAPPVPRNSSKPAKKPASPPRQRQPREQLQQQTPRSTPPASQSIESKPKAIRLQQLLEFNLVSDLDFILRTVVTIVFLTLAYTMEESVWKTLNLEGLNGGEKFVRYFPALIGSFMCFVLFCWFMSVTFSVLMRSVANGSKQVEEWVGFAPSEWLGSFLIFAVSSWFALIPGSLLGYFAMKMTGWFFVVPLLASISFCALLPVVLISAFVNESVYNAFSPAIYGSLFQFPDSWLAAYKLFSIAGVLFLIGMLIVFLPGLIFSFIGSLCQVGGITLYAILIGLHARSITTSMSSEAA